MATWERSNTDHQVPQSGAQTGIAYFSPTPVHTTPSALRTIIFLHGSESNHREFSRVVPLLQDDYNIIAVDLPGHSASRAVPFSFDNIITGLLHIIQTQAGGTKVHLVGLSLGGFIALDFVRRHPEKVESIWCTGCTPFTGPGRWVRSRSILLSSAISAIGLLATEKMFWASLGPGVKPISGFRSEVQKNQNVSTLRPVFDELMAVTWDDFAAIQDLKIAIIAGGKRDSVEDAARAGRMFRSKNAKSQAYVVRDAIHWWSLQFPELFARGIRAWIEDLAWPPEYEALLADTE